MFHFSLLRLSGEFYSVLVDVMAKKTTGLMIPKFENLQNANHTFFFYIQSLLYSF